MSSDTVMIQLHQLQKKFLLGEQEVRALNNISLHINEGEYLSVMGPSGSGKSTLLNILGLLDKPDSGQYQLNGIQTTQLKEEARAEFRGKKIGFVFQSYHLIPRLNAFENVELPLMLAGVSARERRPLVSAALQRLGLSDRIRHLPNQLSGGQRQRVAIARAIVMKPKLILADEPTGNLDSRSGADVMELLEELNAEGITLLMVTHDSELGQRAARQIRMVDGHIIDDAARLV